MPDVLNGASATLFEVKPPRIKMDLLAESALSTVAKDSQENAEKFMKFFKDHFKSIPFSELIDAVGKFPFSNTERMILSNPDIYKALLHQVIQVNHVNPQDTKLLFINIRKYLSDPNEPNSVKAAFIQQLVTNIVNANNRKFESAKIEAVTNLLMKKENFEIGNVNPQEVILPLYDDVVSKGNYPQLVDKYLAKGEINPSTVDDRLRQNMVAYLMNISFPTDTADFTTKFDAGEFDEYFALAYDYAIRVIRGGDDPIDAFRSKADVSEWDFTVDEFETVEEQGIIKENIYAAGALDYIYELGDNLNLFHLADALILEWGNGPLDVPKGTTMNKLYRHLKLKDERATSEERAMLYKRILNKGEGKVLDKMVVNEDFATLWTKLMEEVVKYIEKTEDKTGNESIISKQPIYQAVKELQQNLTAHMTGIAPMMTREMYAHLKDCMDLFDDDNIKNQKATGARKNMWVVIENLAKEEMGFIPNVSAYRTIAVKSNRIFRFIGDFNGMAVQPAEFEQFKEDVESYIIAQSQVGNTKLTKKEESEESDESEDSSDFDD